MADHYRTIGERVECRQKVERSDFLGIAFPIADEPAFFSALEVIQKEHFNATHHCWAFRLRERSRSADAGEPSGTAGKPILAAIESAGFHETAVVVVRWYGGIKLGTGGLARAYRGTAAQTLAGAIAVDRYDYVRFKVEVPYAAVGTVYRLASPPDVTIVSEEFGADQRFDIDVRLSRAEEFAATLVERRLAFERLPR